MKLSKGGGHEARLRQPGSSFVDEMDADDMGRGLMTSFERLQPKKVAKDFYSKGQPDEHSQVVDSEDDKYVSKSKTPKKIIVLLGLVCAIAVVALAYPESHPVGQGDDDQPQQTTSVSVSSRALHNVGPGCRKTGSKSTVELRHPELGNSVTYCDLPKGASLLGLLQLKRHGDGLKIGLVNIDEEEEQNWHQFTLGWARYHVFPFERAPKHLQWSDFYPEWIDEDASPQCPDLPMPSVESPIKLHAVIVKVPCGRRDVGRLQVLLAAATVASRTGDGQSMLVLVISECRPPLNFFPCNELLEQRDDLWLFQVNLAQLRQHLTLPVGSCELSLRLDNNAPRFTSESRLSLDHRPESRLELLKVRRRQEVYATMLHTDGRYVCGAIVAAQSIRLSGSQRDLIALVDENITPEQRESLQLAGWKLHDIERIRNPKSEPLKYNAWNYSKFRLWQLTQYDKVIYIDADLLVLQNMDLLFDMPELSATGNDQSLFNSGVMVIEPSNCTFNILMDQINDIESYNGGDQGFLNEIFPSWHRIPKRLNFLKHFWSNGTKERDEKTTLFRAVDPPSLHVIHYLGRKPWLCYRDYDCNWLSGEYRKYASDSAHARWWEVHDTMPEKLQDQCLLLTKQKANIEYNRRRAAAAGFEDEHWRINITDPRQNVCTESFCNWHSMLKHWGEPRISRRRLQF